MRHEHDGDHERSWLSGTPGGGAPSFLLRDGILPLVRSIVLPADALLEAMDEAEDRGVRGGAIHDFLHLVATRRARADRIYTLNLSHFLAFHRPGDLAIVHP